MPTIHEKVLALRGKYSFSIIAQKLGVTRSKVAGICWRADWPYETRIWSPHGKGGNKCGRGRSTGHAPAMITLNDLRAIR